MLSAFLLAVTVLASRSFTVDALAPQAALLAQKATHLAQLHHEADEPTNSFLEDAKQGLLSILFGAAVLTLGVSMTWFNEERSVRLAALRAAMADVLEVDAYHPDPENRGRLVQVQGLATARAPVRDSRFKDFAVDGCLKLQGTVEVFEWVQTIHVSQSGDARLQARFHTEWTVTHNNSSQFKKPCPENPRLPSDVSLGIATSVCEEACLGAFSLPEDLVSQLLGFEAVAESKLPVVVSAFGLNFVWSGEDGYYYARPTRKAVEPVLFKQLAVGDLRARFLCVPECSVSAMGVQVEKEKGETFVPFRVVPRSICTSELQERLKLIEEGERSTRELRTPSGGCCSLATACCCPCNAFSQCCVQEVVTEEIYCVSEKPWDSATMPFDMVVGRSPWKVATFRIASLAVCYFGLNMILRPLWAHVHNCPGLQIFGGAAAQVLLALLLATTWLFAAAAACWPYQPLFGVLLLLFAALVVVGPAMLDVAHRAAHV